MKKGLLIASRALFAVVLAFCIFKTCSILADTSIFQITKIEVKDKSEGVVVNSVGLSEGQLQNDIVFSAKDDVVKYNITIKNTSNDDYTIKSISDNNDSANLEYTYEDLTNIVVESKAEKTFELQIKYVEETTGLNISNKPVSLTLTYEKSDGTTGSEIITNNDGTSSTTPASDLSEEDEDIVNPNTGDSINKYIIIGLISFVGLIISITKEKQLFKTLAVVGLFATLAIPFGTKADTEAFIIKFNTNKIQNTSTELISGPDLNLMMFKLYNDNDNLIRKYSNPNSVYYYITDPTISGLNYAKCNANHFFRATEEQYNAIKDSLTEKNIISIPDADFEAYMWYDVSSSTLYYYSSAIALLLNEDSRVMFKEVEGFTELDLSEFDTINVTDLKQMFVALHNVKSINLGDNFDTSKVTDMSDFFYECYALQEISLGDKFNTSNVTDMSYMFSGTSNLTSLNLGNNFDTSNVTNMSDMFNQTGLVELNLGNKFDTSNVTNMSDMFNQTDLVELNLGSKFDTSKVTDMSYMFNESYNLKTIYTKYDFDFSSNPDVEEMFSYADSLVGGGGVAYYDHSDYNNSEYARIAGGFFTFIPNDEETYSEIISGPEFNLTMFKLATGIEDLKIEFEEGDNGNLAVYYKDNNNANQYHDIDQVESIKYATKGRYNAVKDNLTADNLISTPESDYPAYMWYEQGTIYIYTEANQLLMSENASFMFANVLYLYDLDMSMFDTRNVTNMKGIFHRMIALESLNLGNNFDTSKVTDMSYMFQYITADSFGIDLDLGDIFDTSNVTNMAHMFEGLHILQTLDLGDKFDTSNVTDMSYMFAYTGIDTLDFGSKFDTSNVTDMSYMFAWMQNLVSLDLGTKFNTTKVTNMTSMFAWMENLVSLDLGNKFDTSNVTNMSYMFSYMYITSIDLGAYFDTSKVTDMSYMFTDLWSIEKIYVPFDFNLISLEDSTEMFGNSDNLVGGSGTTIDYDHTDATYARIDDPEHGRPGYFTLKQY